MNLTVDEITVYSNHCPACNVLTELLEKKGVPYILVDNKEEVYAAAKRINTTSMPFCIFSGDPSVKLFPEMLGYINSL